MYFGHADLLVKLVYGDIISCCGCQKPVWLAMFSEAAGSPHCKSPDFYLN